MNEIIQIHISLSRTHIHTLFFLSLANTPDRIARHAYKTNEIMHIFISLSHTHSLFRSLSLANTPDSIARHKGKINKSIQIHISVSHTHTLSGSLSLAHTPDSIAWHECKINDILGYTLVFGLCCKLDTARTIKCTNYNRDIYIIHIYLHTCACKYIHAYICMYMHVNAYTRECIHTCTNVNIRTYRYLHTRVTIDVTQRDALVFCLRCKLYTAQTYTTCKLREGARDVHMQAYTCIYGYIYIYVYIYIYINTRYAMTVTKRDAFVFDLCCKLYTAHTHKHTYYNREREVHKHRYIYMYIYIYIYINIYIFTYIYIYT